MTDEVTPPRRPRGRPTRLTPETMSRVLNAIRSGAFLNAAAAYAGVRPSTLYGWWKRGREAKSGRYRELSDGIERALADSELRATYAVVKAFEQGEWRAALAYLSKRFPTRWSDRQTVDVRGSGAGGALQHEIGLAIRVIPSREVDAEGRVIGVAALPSGMIDAGAVVGAVVARQAQERMDEEES